MLLTILLVLLILAIAGGGWGYSRDPALAWPGGILGVVLVILLVLALMGRI